MSNRLLITGAFGNLGLMCIEQALAQGFSVRCFDLDTRKNRREAKRFGHRIEALFGDITDHSVHDTLVSEVDAVLHLASLLPPLTETSPVFARKVNVEATFALIAAVKRSSSRPRFVFPSSVTVFGMPSTKSAIRSVGDTVSATDNYTEHKLAIEKALQASSIPWVVMRVGVSVDARTLAADRSTLRQLLGVSPTNRLEYVHPRDVALAMCNAAVSPEAANKILLIGGGEPCRITQREFLKAPFEALGLKLPSSVHGTEGYYTHWMETGDSQQLLQFQQHEFADYQREMHARLKPVRRAIAPFRWLINPLLPRLLKAI